MIEMKEFSSDTEKSQRSGKLFLNKEKTERLYFSSENDDEVLEEQKKFINCEKKQLQHQKIKLDLNSSGYVEEGTSQMLDKSEVQSSIYEKSSSQAKVAQLLSVIMAPNFFKSFLGMEHEEDCYLYRDHKWEKMKLMITQERLAFISLSLEFEKIEKIKIIPTPTNRPEKMIKIQCNGNDYYSTMSYLSVKKGLPFVYYVFAKVIMKKLHLNKVQEYESWQKSEHSQPTTFQNSQIYGQIYKKSQYLKEWHKRYVVVKQQGIYSYKDPKKNEKYSFFIPKSSIKYIWTRFYTFEGYLVIKVKHGMSKTEFGIPIKNYLKKHPENWLFELYKLV